MAAALRAAEGGGVYFFQILRGGYFQNFSGQGGISAQPPYSRPLDTSSQFYDEFNMNNTALLFDVSEGIAHAKQLCAELR